MNKYKIFMISAFAAFLSFHGVLAKAETKIAAPTKTDTSMEQKKQTGAPVMTRMEKLDKLKKDLETKRMKAQEMITTKEKAFDTKFKAIKDEAKKATALVAAKQLNKINQATTDGYARFLDTLDSILEKIKTRAAKIASADMTQVKAAIASAEKAIDAARALVTTQAGKVYDVEVSTDKNVGLHLGTVRKTLEADLKMVREKGIVPAREALNALIVALKKAVGVSTDANPSTNPAPTVTPPAGNTNQ